MSEQLKQLLFNYLIDECDTPEPTTEDMKIQYEAGVIYFGSQERLEYFLSAWYSRSILVPVPHHINAMTV
jgi:hypothetical protein